MFRATAVGEMLQEIVETSPVAHPHSRCQARRCNSLSDKIVGDHAVDCAESPRYVPASVAADQSSRVLSSREDPRQTSAPVTCRSR